ncbi:MAG: hypothetical protein ACE5IW_12520 [bacterium]
MGSRSPIDPNHIRKITGSFSWLDHRLLHDGYLAAMAPEEMLLYFFLVLVGDRQGVSFYGYDKICTLLKLDLERFLWARDRLVQKSLIACKHGRFQVLQLPEQRKPFVQVDSASGANREHGLKSLAEIFSNLTQGKA